MQHNRINDTVFVSYLFYDFECEIIGFVNEGYSIYYNNRNYNLDNLIIIRAFEISNIKIPSVTSFTYFQMQYLNLINGTILTSKSEEQLIKELNEITSLHNIPNLNSRSRDNALKLIIL